LLICAALAGVACGHGNGGAGEGSSAGGPGGTPTPSSCTTENPPSAPLRRLTRIEYNNTVRDLLGVTTSPADTFPPDEVSGVFNNDARVLSVPPLLAEKYMDAAEALAAGAVGNLSKLVGCDPAGVGEETCARQFVERFGRRAYRRPITMTETTRLMKVFTDARAQGDFAWGVEVVVQAVLQSPQFLYRFEPGLAAGPGDKVLRLTPYELASRLSYLVWATMPDDRLSAAADSGQLTTSDQVATMVREMLKDPRARPAMTEFYRQWLGMGALETVSKDPKVYPEFTEAMRTELEAETPAFVERVLWTGDAKLKSLLVADAPPPTGETAQRPGVLSLASVLAVYGLPNQSSPIHRGKLVRERFLCQDMPPPPPQLMVMAPEVDPSKPTSERFAQHRADVACASCHDLMDPIGLGFEAYDGIGRYRAMDGGKPVDDSGAIVGGTDVDGPFRGARELVGKLATSAQVRQCVGLQWFRYAFGRGEEAADRCSLDGIDAALVRVDGDLRELVVALTQTDTFLFRKAITGGAP
jgi:hypothetical protein